MKNKKNFIERINYLSSLFLISERVDTVTKDKNTVIKYDSENEIINFKRSFANFNLHLNAKNIKAVDNHGQEDDYINNIPFKKINFLKIKKNIKKNNEAIDFETIKNIVEKDVEMILNVLKLVLERYHDGKEKEQVIIDIIEKQNLIVDEIMKEIKKEIEKEIEKK
jgi:hypothetical protein